MDCREAQKRLTESRLSRPNVDLDPDLRTHLQTCPECADAVEQVRALTGLFDAASVDDADGIKPLTRQREEVEARLDRSGSPARRAYRGRARLLGRTPSYALGAVASLAIIMLALLLPFDGDNVIGYDLSIHGVEEDLATDSDRLCDMLFALGATNAGVDVGQCDTTCRVVIFDLKSKREARLVEAAIENLSGSSLTTRVIPITDWTTGS